MDDPQPKMLLPQLIMDYPPFNLLKFSNQKTNFAIIPKENLWFFGVT